MDSGLVTQEKGGELPLYLSLAVSDLTFLWAHIAPHSSHTEEALEAWGGRTGPFVLSPHEKVSSVQSTVWGPFQWHIQSYSLKDTSLLKFIV